MKVIAGVFGVLILIIGLYSTSVIWSFFGGCFSQDGVVKRMKAITQNQWSQVYRDTQSLITDSGAITESVNLASLPDSVIELQPLSVQPFWGGVRIIVANCGFDPVDVFVTRQNIRLSWGEDGQNGSAVWTHSNL